MAESDTDKFTRAARNQEYPLRLFQKNRTETWIYNLNCLKLQCQSRTLPIWQKLGEEIHLQI